MQKVRLLVCDDHALFRAGIRAVLREQPALDVVGEAANGRAAVDEAARLRPDVVLMDALMPRLDGFEATRRIVKAQRGVRVLMLSMYAEETLVARSLEAGASGYVLKDVPVAELARAIQAVAGGGRYLSAGAAPAELDARAHSTRRAQTRFDLLTSREREVLKLLAEGLSVKEVAVALDRSVKTVEVHKTNLMRKLGVHDRAGLVKCAIAHRLVPLPLFDDAAASPPARKPS